MNREKLIESIIESSGLSFGPGSRSRRRLAGLDHSLLQRLESDAQASLEAGRQRRASALDSSARIAESMARAEVSHAAWTQAVKQWHAFNFARHNVAKVPEGTLVLQNSGASRPAPSTREILAYQAGETDFSGLSRVVLRQTAWSLSHGQVSEPVLAKIEIKLLAVVSSYLEYQMTKIAQDVARLMMQQADPEIATLMTSSIARAWIDDGRIRSQQLFHTAKTVTDGEVTDALARAALCYNLLSPSEIIEAPKSRAFGGFLRTCAHAFRSGSGERLAPHNEETRKILIVVESADDPEAIQTLLREKREELRTDNIVVICLLGTHSVGRVKDSQDIFTMATLAGERVETPWHSDGQFATIGEDFVFGDGSDQPFRVAKEYLAQRFRSVAEESAIAYEN